MFGPVENERTAVEPLAPIAAANFMFDVVTGACVRCTHASNPTIAATDARVDAGTGIPAPSRMRFIISKLPADPDAGTTASIPRTSIRWSRAAGRSAVRLTRASAKRRSASASALPGFAAGSPIERRSIDTEAASALARSMPEWAKSQKKHSLTSDVREAISSSCQRGKPFSINRSPISRYDR